VIHQPAFETVRAVDTTGAGDAFHGGFLYGTLNLFDLKRSLEFASAVAALNTRALGGRTSLPTHSEVQALLLASSTPR